MTHHHKISVSSPIEDTARVAQVRGLFDIPEAKHTGQEWDVTMPLDEKSWNIGLIVGPSGCGKSTIARHFWPDCTSPAPLWPKNNTVVDAFPEELGIKQITELLSSVGFSTPPAWLRPYHVLSTGQQFRVTLARLIADQLQWRARLGDNLSPTRPIVYDEYTSVVDRTVAQIASAALSKTIRNHHLQFVAVTCHEDVEPWIQPDWIYRPAEGQFLWRSLQRRPTINLRVFRCRPTAWALFAPHHYLSTALLTSAICFLASYEGLPAVFSAWLPFMGAGPAAKREHRTVTLPDYQGVGMGNAVSATVAAMWKALGYNALSTTTHPAMIRSRNKSPLWQLIRQPALIRSSTTHAAQSRQMRHATTRMTAGFRFIGDPLPVHVAKALLAS
jgi:energy-coupling factor transporter ATP-binding protein EcfA2